MAGHISCAATAGALIVQSEWQADSTVIDCVRVRGSQDDDAAVRRSLESEFRTATLRPSHLPSAAILIVRRLTVPEPAHIASGSRNHLRSSEWESLVNAELDRIAVEAARPSRGAVSSSTKCVWFADRSEMLACLALDWMSGAVRDHWWWSCFIGRDGVDASLGREWLSSPDYVPSALELLATRSQAVTFVKKLGDELVESLTRRVCEAFAMPEPIAIDPETQLSDIAARARTSNEPGPVEDFAAGTPWVFEVPEANSPGLTSSRRIFLAQTLMIRRGARKARSRSFVQAIARWKWVIDTNAAAPFAKDRNGAEDTLSLGPASHPLEELCSHADDSPAGTQLQIDERRSDRQPAFSKDSSNADEASSNRDPLAQELPLETIGSGRPMEKTQPTPEYDSATHAQSDEMTSRASAYRPHDRIEAATVAHHQSLSSLAAHSHKIQSSFAGVFFLLNMALALGLYADFTSPQGKNLELDIWDLLWFLAVRFLGREAYEDGLHLALATLAGRTTDDTPGRYFQPPRDWQLPPKWLDAFPEAFKRNELITGTRSQLVHPAGFVLEDKGLVPSPGGEGSIDVWISWISAYIRARLIRAMGTEDAVELLCRVPGSVSISEAHLDVHYSLQQYPIEIRLAGLDRDPGWIPAGGRHVAYHFD